jgi:hypothetical protein
LVELFCFNTLKDELKLKEKAKANSKIIERHLVLFLILNNGRVIGRSRSSLQSVPASRLEAGFI